MSRSKQCRCGRTFDISHFQSFRDGKETVKCLSCRKSGTASNLKTGRIKKIRGMPATVHTIIDGIEYKTCSKCKEHFELKNFRKISSTSDGLSFMCKLCDQKRRDSMSEEEKKAAKTYAKDYKEKNKEKIKIRDKKYIQDHKEEINLKRREKRKDPHNKLYEALGKRIRNAIKYQGAKKNERTMELTGCTAGFLRKYFESQFEEGMTWENHGNDPKKCWHIDHIRPCASFDLTDEAQQRECFHYSNLQPMWGLENIIKGDTWIPEDHIFHKEVTIRRGSAEISISWQSGCFC